MLRYNFVIAAVLGAASCASAKSPAQNARAVAASPSFEGQWVNERGSAVTFSTRAGQLSGYYQTALGAPDKTTRFPLTGFIAGDQITFTVNFTGYGSLTAWTGQMSRDAQGDYIRTLWHLTRDIDDADEDDKLWQSITAGASHFRRVKEPTP